MHSAQQRYVQPFHSESDERLRGGELGELTYAVTRDQWQASGQATRHERRLSRSSGSSGEGLAPAKTWR